MIWTPINQALVHVLHRVFLECPFARGGAEVIVPSRMRRYILCIFLVYFHPADQILSQINHLFRSIWVLRKLAPAVIFLDRSNEASLFHFACVLVCVFFRTEVFSEAYQVL